MISKQNLFLIGIVISGIILLIISFIIASTTGSGITWLFFGLFILSIIAFFIVLLIDIPDFSKNIEERNQLLKETREQNLKVKIESEKLKAIEEQKIEKLKENLTKDYVDLYGSITKEIKLVNDMYPQYKSESNDNKVFIFESSFKIIIQKKVLCFADIIAFELKDDEQIIYKSSISTSKSSALTGSMIGRAVVGGVLLGGVGAVVGGATANKNTTTINTPQQASVTHKYKVHIIVNSISERQIVLNLGKNEEAANEIVAVLSVILKRNN